MNSSERCAMYIFNCSAGKLVFVIRKSNTEIYCFLELIKIYYKIYYTYKTKEHCPKKYYF